MAGFEFQAKQFIVNLRGNGEPLQNDQWLGEGGRGLLVTRSALYFRNHRLTGLGDCLKITHPVMTSQGARATTLRVLDGL